MNHIYHPKDSLFDRCEDGQDKCTGCGSIVECSTESRDSHMSDYCNAWQDSCNDADYVWGSAR